MIVMDDDPGPEKEQREQRAEDAQRDGAHRVCHVVQLQHRVVIEMFSRSVTTY